MCCPLITFPTSKLMEQECDVCTVTYVDLFCQSLCSYEQSLIIVCFKVTISVVFSVLKLGFVGKNTGDGLRVLVISKLDFSKN